MDTYKKTIQEGIVKTTKQQMQVARYDSQTEYPQDACIHLLFEAQVERTPDAVAVVFEDQQITYRELNALANSLGH